MWPRAHRLWAPCERGSDHVHWHAWRATVQPRVQTVEECPDPSLETAARKVRRPAKTASGAWLTSITGKTGAGRVMAQIWPRSSSCEAQSLSAEPAVGAGN